MGSRRTVSMAKMFPFAVNAISSPEGEKSASSVVLRVMFSLDFFEMGRLCLSVIFSLSWVVVLNV